MSLLLDLSVSAPMQTTLLLRLWRTHNVHSGVHHQTVFVFVCVLAGTVGRARAHGLDCRGMPRVLRSRIQLRGTSGFAHFVASFGDHKIITRRRY